MPVETVNTVVVQDREYGQDGKPLVNQEVTIRLAPGVIFLVAAAAAGNTDQVALQPTEVRVKTDSTGFWSVPLVSNNVITPSNTYYSVKVGLLKTYDIQIPAGAGPFIASNILTGALPLFPGGSSVAGPITITGNLSVTGTGTYTGALQANGGLAVLGGSNLSGGLTASGGLTLAGLLTMTDAVSRLVPGATSFAIRDNANANDNLLVSNAGAVTVRNGLTVTAGDIVITAGRLLLSAAAAKIKGGATSLSLRNNADTADNWLLADAGQITSRGPISTPGTLGGAVAPTSYGTYPVKVDEQTPSGTGTVTLTIPSGYRSGRIIVTARSSAAVAAADLQVRVNGSSATDYEWTRQRSESGGGLFDGGSAQTQMVLGFIVGTTGPTNAVGYLEIRFHNYASGRDKNFIGDGAYPATTYGAGNNIRVLSSGFWKPASPATIATISLLLSSGNYTDALIELWMEP